MEKEPINRAEGVQRKKSRSAFKRNMPWYKKGWLMAIVLTLFSTAVGYIQFCLEGQRAENQRMRDDHRAKLEQSQAFLALSLGILGDKSAIGMDGTPEEFPESQQALRKWALELLNKNANLIGIRKIEGSEADALIQGIANLPSKWHDTGTYYDNGYGLSDYIFTDENRKVIQSSIEDHVGKKASKNSEAPPIESTR